MHIDKKNKASSRYIKAAALLIVVSAIAGCSSERFSDSFYSSAVPSSQDAAYGQTPYQTATQSNSTVESSQLLPPPQQVYTQPTPSSSQQYGTPPQNLGVVPANAEQSISRQSTYTVQRGDTLYNISRRAGVSVNSLESANNINDGIIHLGQTLIIPGGNSVSARVDTPAERKASQTPKSQTVVVANPTPNTARNVTQPSKTTPNVAPPSVASAPRASTPANPASAANQKTTALAPQATGIAKLRWPVQGRILSSFGQKEGNSVNDGIDIMVPEGASVKAAENGVVIDAVNGLKKFGNTILIRHENNIVTVYGHNSQIFVQRGQSVRRGDEIAKSGMSGDAPTPRVHFEVRKNAAPVNPMDYLEN